MTFDSGNRKESLAELWSEFLEQEVGTPKGEDSVSGTASTNGLGLGETVGKGRNKSEASMPRE